MDPLKREIPVQVCRPTACDSCDGGISVIYNCLSWYKFVNTHLYQSRQLYNIHDLCFSKVELDHFVAIIKQYLPEL